MSLKLVLGLGVAATGVYGNGKAPNIPEPVYQQEKVTAVEVPAVPYCPDGSIYDVTSGCAYVDYAPPRPECPHPYKLDKHSGNCGLHRYGEISLICPKGSYLHRHRCVSEITAPVDMYCKHTDSILTEEGCLRRSEPEMVKEEYLEPKLTCPRHFRLDGKTCVSETAIDADLFCEDGATLHGHHCMLVDIQPPICDQGYNLKDGLCETNIAADLIPSCPKHTRESKGQCFETIYNQPNYVCEKGYELTKKGKCEARILITAIMDKKMNAAVPFDCKHGEMDAKGNCYQFYYSHPVPICEPGFNLHKKKCVSEVPVAPLMTCPHGYKQDKGSCIKHGKHRIRCPHGYDLDEITGMCTRTVKVAPTTVCPKGTTSLHGGHKKGCAILEFQTPIATCHKGYDLVGDMCVKPATVHTSKNKVYKPVTECPKGFKLNHEELMCYSLLESDPTPVCEKGYDLNGHGKCVLVHQVPAQAMCPKGFTNGGAKSKDGASCMRVSFNRPLFNCPDGSVEKGHGCYVYQDAGPVVTLPLNAGSKKA